MPNMKPFLLFINWQKEMFSKHTPALFEFSSGINRFTYLRNKGNHVVRVNLTRPIQGFVERRCILYQIRADQLPKPL